MVGWDHVSTFDGNGYAFGGQCKYVLFKDNNNAESPVTIRVVKDPFCDANARCKFEVNIEIRDKEDITIKSNRKVQRSGQDTQLPFNNEVVKILEVQCSISQT